jgi:hypothetical protein
MYFGYFVYCNEATKDTNLYKMKYNFNSFMLIFQQYLYIIEHNNDKINEQKHHSK